MYCIDEDILKVVWSAEARMRMQNQTWSGSKLKYELDIEF
jgi:hypothetical protein